MTRAWVFSDLHMRDSLVGMNHFLQLGGIPDADVCVVAGDFMEGDPVDAVSLLDDLIAPVMPVIYVLGNHEFYSSERTIEVNRGLAQRAAERTDGRVSVLDDRAVVIGGIRFVGSTLWSDFQLYSDDPTDIAYAMKASADAVNDFRLIRTGFRTWTPDDAREQHSQSLVWLDREMANSAEPVVVVSHHAPSMGSLHPDHERDLASAAFVSRLEDVIEHHQPALWIHGHTHHSFDYSIGATKIVCNPRGYGMENASRWDPALVIEIDDLTPRLRL